MSFTPTTVAQLYLQVQNAINGHLDTNTYGQPATWVLSFITDWYSTNPLPFTLGQLKYIGMTPGQMKVAWSQMGGDIDGEATNDTSGVSVSLSDDGTIMAIGADWNDGNTGNSDDNRGHVRVFKYKQFTNDMKDQYHYSNQIQDSNQTKSLIITSKDENGNYVAPENNNFYWTQMGIDIDGEAGEDNSGWSVSLSSDGNIVAIGAYYNDGNGSDSGHVRVYQYTNDSWVQMGTDIDGEAANDWSGYSVSLSSDGTIVAIGARYNDGNGNASGHVRVYQYTNGSWSKMGDDIDGEAAEDWSGASVSLSSDGTIVAIGARLNDANGNASGHVRVYQYDGSAWVQMGTDIDGEATDDWSGNSVSLSDNGTIVAIGARLNDANGSNSGHVRVYEYTNDSWVQMGNDIDGEAASDYSGWSVSLSSDGTIVAIGAIYNSDNGTNSGHVRVYQYTNGSWNQLGTDIDGEAPYNYSGYSVSLSSDGSIVAIGALGNNDNGYFSGHVRVFDLSNGYSLANLKYAGFDATSVQTDGYTISDLQSAGYTDEQITAAGYSASLLKTYGYNASQLNNGDYTVSQLISGGYTLGQLVYAGYTYSKLIAAGFTGAEIKDSWIQLGGDLDGEFNQSGTSVSLSSDGTIVAIGAIRNDLYSGHVRVYKYTNGSWVQKGGDIDGEAYYDWSGWSVSLSSDGTIVAIGASFNDGNGTSSGHVRVFEWKEFTQSMVNQYYYSDQTQDGNQPLPLIITSKDTDGNYVEPLVGFSYWTQMGIDIDGEAQYDYSGYSVSLSDNGTIVAIGAYGNDGTNGSNSGHVRVFEYDTDSSSWVQLGIDIDGEAAGDYSGYSVSLSSDGTIVAIGARYNADSGTDSGHVRTDSGHVRVYEWNGTAWVQKGGDIDGEVHGDWSGTSVSLSSDGSIVAIGATGNDANGADSGHVRVFEYDTDSSSWVQKGGDIDGEATGDGSGNSVSLSSDGTIVAIGARSNDGNGSDSGHVRVYQYDNNTSSWVQLGTDIDGEAAGDQSGYSVSLSSDGTIVAIGAPYNDGNGSYSGNVRTYKYGISASILTAAGATATQLKTAGFYASELKASGYTARDLIRLYNNSEILEAGYTIEQLTVPLFSASELLAAGNTLTDLKNGGTNAAELHEDGYSFDQLRLAGFSAVDCRNANMSNSEIVASGFSITQLREGGISAKRMKNAGYNARELYENGYPVPQLFEAGYSASEIRLAGVDALQARFGGIKTGEMKSAGYTVEEYKAASYKASRMKEAGYTRAELEGVYSEEELDAVGL